VQWLLFAPSVRAALPPTEPLATWIFAGFGVALLIGSTRRFALERRLVEQQHAAAANEKMARAFLAVRDLANTPLQTIESATAVARILHPEADVPLGQIERALDKMRKLSRLLSRHEPSIRWREGDESFDATLRLEDTGGGPHTDKH
jgi:hypothetical protein